MIGTGKDKEVTSMEPFENNELENETETPQPDAEEAVPQPEQAPSAQPQEEPQQTAYHGTGAGRKESPYANSPYVMDQHPQQEYRYQPQTEPPQKPEKVHKEKKPRKPVWKGIVACLAVAAMVAGGCLITANSVNEYWEARTEDTVKMLTDKIEALEDQIGSTASGNPVILPSDGTAMAPNQLYASCVDSVVAISATVQTSSIYGTQEGAAAGSGFILTEDGYIITNYHVVEDSTAIDVIIHDGTEYAAELVGYDSTNDIAVLKVDAAGLSAATLGSSSDLVIGDMVVAIGNPLGELTSTQTVGYVSGINREVATDNITTISMIQTDAAINPGNSGGPLFNTKGEVIGITTAKYSGTTGSGASIEGIGFAIPIDDVVPLVDDLIDYGYVTGAYMAVTVQNTDAESASMFGLPTGAYIVSVEKDGAADRAGIQAKDIVIALGEYEVSNVTDLTRALRNFKAGDTTTIKVIRSGKEITLDITLDEKPQQTPAASAPQSGAEMPSSGSYDEWFDYFRRYFGE